MIDIWVKLVSDQFELALNLTRAVFGLGEREAPVSVHIDPARLWSRIRLMRSPQIQWMNRKKQAGKKNGLPQLCPRQRPRPGASRTDLRQRRRGDARAPN